MKTDQGQQREKKVIYKRELGSKRISRVVDTWSKGEKVQKVTPEFLAGRIGSDASIPWERILLGIKITLHLRHLTWQVPMKSQD